MNMSRPRGRAPSLRMIAEKAGVSTATVSRVINGQEASFAPETVERIRAVIKEVGYRPQHSGRALRTRQSSIIAALSADPSNAYYAAISQSIEAVGRGQNCVLLLADTRGEAERQDECLMDVLSYNARGVVMFGSQPTPLLEKLVGEGFPIVFILRPSTLKLPTSIVGVDNLKAGADVADYFHGAGLGPVGALLGTEGSPASDARVKGLLDRMRCHGQSVFLSPDRGVAAPLMESGYLQAKRMLNEHPEVRAMFCPTDMIAYGAYRRCYELGLRVPEDVVLFGFDDNPLNQWVAPWLSTVRTPYEDFGEAVWGLFEKLWSGAERAPTVTLPHELVIRPDGRPPKLSART